MDVRVVLLLEAGVAQLVEHLPSKQDVASSNLVARSMTGLLAVNWLTFELATQANLKDAHVAQW